MTLDATKTVGELELVIEKTATQGSLTGVTLEAAHPSGRVKAETPLDAFVRGAPGEIDTTFATNGVVTLPTAPNGYETAMDGDGKLYVLDQASLKRFGVDGNVDATFGTSGTAMLEPNIAGLPFGVVVAGSSVLVGTASFLSKRTTTTGAADPSYTTVDAPSRSSSGSRPALTERHACFGQGRTAPKSLRSSSAPPARTWASEPTHSPRRRGRALSSRAETPSSSEEAGSSPSSKTTPPTIQRSARALAIAWSIPAGSSPTLSRTNRDGSW